MLYAQSQKKKKLQKFRVLAEAFGIDIEAEAIK